MGLRFGHEPLLHERGQWKNNLGCEGIKRTQRTKYKMEKFLRSPH